MAASEERGEEEAGERKTNGEGGHLRKTEERHHLHLLIYASRGEEGGGDSYTWTTRLHEIEGKGEGNLVTPLWAMPIRPTSRRFYGRYPYPILSKRENKLAIVPRSFASSNRFSGSRYASVIYMYIHAWKIIGS